MHGDNNSVMTVVIFCCFTRNDQCRFKYFFLSFLYSMSENLLTSLLKLAGYDDNQLISMEFAPPVLPMQVDTSQLSVLEHPEE